MTRFWRRSAKKGAWLPWACAAGLAVYHVVLAYQWVSRDKQPPQWDPAVHLGTTLDYREALEEGRWSGLLITRPRPGHPQYPPIYHYSLVPFIRGARPELAAVWINLAYLAVTIASAFWIAWRLAGPWPACAAMVALGLSPRLVHIYRDVFVDVSLTAWVTLAYALVLKSDFFSRRRESLLAAAAAALAVLSKWGAVLYLLPAAAAGLADKPRRRNLALALAVVAAASVPWYLVNGLTMASRIWTSVTLGPSQGNPHGWSLSNLLYYPTFLAASFSWPAVVLMLFGTARTLVKPDAWRAKALVASWLAFSYAFCTAVPSKEHRYFLPALAALPVVGLAGLPPPLLAVSAALALYHAQPVRRPNPGDWHLRDILKTVEARRPRPSLVSLCLLANHPELNSNTVTWIARHEGFENISTACQQTEIPEWADFVLVKTADPGAFLSDRTYAILRAVQDEKSLFHRVFARAGSWRLPDGSDAVLYEARGDFPALPSRRFPELTVKNARLQDARITSLGRRSYSVSIAALTLEKLAAPIRGIRLELGDARLVESDGRIYVLSVGRVALREAALRWEDLERAIQSRSGLAIALAAEGGKLKARYGDVELVASIRLEPGGPLPVFSGGGTPAPATPGAGSLRVDLDGARLAGLALPFTHGWSWKFDLSPHPPYQPYAIALGPIRLDPAGLVIGP